MRTYGMPQYILPLFLCGGAMVEVKVEGATRCELARDTVRTSFANTADEALAAFHTRSNP